MLLALIAVLAGALAGWTAGRRPSGGAPAGRRGDRRPPAAGRSGRGAPAWKVPVLLPVAGVVLVVGERWVGGGSGLAVMSAGYAGLIGFALANGRRRGLALIAVGLLGNLAVTVADGGMPVRHQPAGVQIGDHHHGLSRADHLAGLADDIPVSLLGETVSPGDLLIAAGGAVAFFFWLEPEAARTRRRRSRSRGSPNRTPARGHDDARHDAPDGARIGAGQPVGRY